MAKFGYSVFCIWEQKVSPTWCNLPICTLIACSKLIITNASAQGSKSLGVEELPQDACLDLPVLLLLHRVVNTNVKSVLHQMLAASMESRSYGQKLPPDQDENHLRQHLLEAVSEPLRVAEQGPRCPPDQ